VAFKAEGDFWGRGNGPGENVQGGNCPDPRQTDGLHKETARTHRGIKRSGILSTGVRVAFFMITVTSLAVIFIYYKLRACNLTRRRPLGARRWSSWLAILGNPLNPLRAYRPTLRVVAPWQWGRKVCRYNWHSAGSLVWPLPMLKYKYIFQIKYTEATFIKQHSELSGFEITKLIIVVQEEKLLCHLL